MKNLKLIVLALFIISILFIVQVSANNENSLKEGRYYIYSSIDDKYALDVKNNNIQLSIGDYSLKQTWIIKRLKNGTYQIINGENNNYSLDVYDERKENGTNIQIYMNNDTSAQQWIIKKVDSNKYKLISKCNYLSLDIKDGIAKENQNIESHKDTEVSSQEFIFVPVVSLENNATISNGNYSISSYKDMNYNLRTNKSKIDNNTNIELRRFNGSIDEYWYIEKLSNGYYKIASNRNNKYVLTVNKGHKLNGTNISLNEYTGSINQQFKIEKNNDTFIIISRSNGLVLDIKNGNMIDNNNIQTYNLNNTQSQKWYLTKEEDTYYNSKELSLDDINTNANKLMIVAHPDDETIWGSHALKDEKYLVVCVTCGPTRRDRVYEFRRVMNTTEDDYMMLGFPDLVKGKKSEWKDEYSTISDQLETIIKSKDWESIVTHNPEGEYGHIHHKMVNKMVTSKANHKILSYFGKYYNENIPQEILSDKLSDEYFNYKKELLKIYETQVGAINNLRIMHHYEHWLTYDEWNKTNINN